MTTNLMLKTYETISAVDRSEGGARHVIKGFRFTLKEDCANDYHTDQLAVIPAGTEIIADFAGDFGIYAMCEVDGAIHKIKIKLHELHKIDFGPFDARNPAGIEFGAAVKLVA